MPNVPSSFTTIQNSAITQPVNQFYDAILAVAGQSAELSAINADLAYVATIASRLDTFNVEFNEILQSETPSVDFVENTATFVFNLPRGLDGATGSVGAEGVMGPVGDTGPTGPQGATGSNGLQGIQGIQGIQGVTGDTGPQGIQGVQGISGFDVAVANGFIGDETLFNSLITDAPTHGQTATDKATEAAASAVNASGSAVSAQNNEDITSNDRAAVEVIKINVTSLRDQTNQYFLAAQLDAWEAEAAKRTAVSYTTESIGVNTTVWTSNGDGTFHTTVTTDYSMLHWVDLAANLVGLTPAAVKTQYESNPDTNAYTDADLAKVGFISITQAVDLDQLELDAVHTNRATLDLITDPFLVADRTKLDGIEALATADMTDAEIKTAYENNADTNEFTDVEKTKLGTVDTNATDDQTGAEIKALYEAEADTNAFTDANVTTLGTAEQTANKGQINGYASLDGSGLVPSGQLPSYVDDVIESVDFASLPGTGETGKIYVTLDNNKAYRWSGAAYIYITSGAVDSVAGKTGVVTLDKNDVGLSNVDNTSDVDKPVSTATALAIGVNATSISDHEALVNNPHAVTKLQIGLGNVDDTSDLDKPISTAVQTALDAKEGTITANTAYNKDFGTNAGEVSEGNHNHDTAYEPAGSGMINALIFGGN